MNIKSILTIFSFVFLAITCLLSGCGYHHHYSNYGGGYGSTYVPVPVVRVYSPPVVVRSYGYSGFGGGYYGHRRSCGYGSYTIHVHHHYSY